MYTDLYVATIIVQQTMRRSHDWARREYLIAQLGPRPSRWDRLRRAIVRGLATVRVAGGRDQLGSQTAEATS
jgi:hypothetical protein